MTILYEYQGNLYVNLTNKCPCNCRFCLRQNRSEMGSSGSLWLEREPTADEVIAEMSKFDMSKYGEFVYCGFGEPTERLDILLESARYFKSNYSLPVRVNTNGLSDLINGKRTAPLFEGKADTISISLNTPDRDEYYALTRSRFGPEAFDALLSFAADVKAYVPKVVLSTVATTISHEQEERCREICDELGVIYRIRPFEN